MTKIAVLITVAFVSLALLSGVLFVLLFSKVEHTPAPTTTVQETWKPPCIVLDRATVHNVDFEVARDSNNNVEVEIDNSRNNFPSHYQFHVSLFSKGSQDKKPIYECDFERTAYPNGSQSESLPKQKCEVYAKLSNIRIKS